MQDNLEILERKQKDHLSRVTPEEYTSWLASHMTKAFLLQFTIDLEDIMRCWMSGAYTDKEGYKAQGTAAYLNDMVKDIDGFLGFEEEENA